MTPADIVSEFRTFAIDHHPDGYPAVMQSSLTAAADAIEQLQKEVAELKAALERAPERDYVPAADLKEGMFAAAYIAGFEIITECNDTHVAVGNVIITAPLARYTQLILK